MAPAPNPVLPLPTASVLGIPPIVNHLAQPPFPGLAGLPTGLSIGAATVDSVGIPSECLLLKNMFDPSIEVMRFFFCICICTILPVLLKVYCVLSI